MAEDTNVDALNEGLNTPVYDDEDPPGYGDDETEEVEAVADDTTEEAEEEESADDTKGNKSQDDEDEEPKPLSRAQQRFQTLANEKKLALQRAELLERQLELERQNRQPPRQQEEENLTELEKWQRQADQTIRQVQAQNLDMQDRSEFLMQVSKNPAEAAYIERVEQTLAEARKAGINPKREDVLIRLMGLDARSKMKQAPAVKRDAAQRVSAAKGKPLAVKSNVAATKTASTEYDRLKDIIL